MCHVACVMCHVSATERMTSPGKTCLEYKHKYKYDDTPRKDMLEACRESRHSGKMVEKLVEGIAVQVSQSGYIGYIRDEVNQSGNIGD